MGTAKSSVGDTFNSHGYCGDYLACGRPPLRIARSVLGRDSDARGHAINARRDSVDFGRTRRGYRAGCCGGSTPGNLVYPKSLCLRRRGVCAGTFVRHLSHGKKRVSLCERHTRHHFAHSALERGLDRCASPFLRSLGWNHRRFSTRGCVAGASTRVREPNRRVNCCGGRVARGLLGLQPTRLLLQTTHRAVNSLGDANNTWVIRPA
jgi:hypothetical protein